VVSGDDVPSHPDGVADVLGIDLDQITEVQRALVRGGVTPQVPGNGDVPTRTIG